MERISYSSEFVCPKCGRHTALLCKTDGTHQAHCLFCNEYYDVEVAAPTNADRIRAMTDEELARFLDNTDGDSPPNAERCSIEESEEYWLEWLKREAISD